MSPSQASSDDFHRLSDGRNFDVWKARMSAPLDGKHLLGFVTNKDYNWVSDKEEESDMSDIDDDPKAARTARLTQIANPSTSTSESTASPQLGGRHAEPNRFPHAILDQFEPESGAKPPLNKVKTFLSHHKGTMLKENDFVEDLENLAMRFKFHVDMADRNSFFFGINVDENGVPAFEVGSDEDPLLLACRYHL
ncbi:unnamed protein product [Phytophthora fragariaefolia]|uniref:Unnamed protein product n=1 Tax=Phytophthora fragariaefolia TaxID=1490495 RepID=A0A9W6Y4A4_9STRA|nr:unnamed protein product [Phytophthora fragariaefolia]